MGELRDFSQLQEATDKNLIDFLQTDLGICQTFADVVRTEMQMEYSVAAQRVFTKAEQAYATIAHFLLRVQSVQQKDEIQCKLAGLRITLDSLQQEFNLSVS